ncbi:hypothetical protein BU17DRAFT_68699 [Hysterangium stoloniferum]|nr:hypothetical protein BU17DRAFT_68699 [Hysterangium stoloniferum]
MDQNPADILPQPNFEPPLPLPFPTLLHSEFRAAIASAIPDIIALLKDPDEDVRSSAVSELAKFSEQAEFRPAIARLIPDIVALLEDAYFETRTNVLDLLVQLAAHDSFREAIIGCKLERHCISLVNNDDDEVVSNAGKLFVAFAQYGYFTDIKLHIVISALCHLYLPEPPLQHRGTLIEILLKSTCTSHAILEVAHIISFIIHFMEDISAERIRAFIVQMDRHGLLTTLLSHIVFHRCMVYARSTCNCYIDPFVVPSYIPCVPSEFLEISRISNAQTYDLTVTAKPMPVTKYNF